MNEFLRSYWGAFLTGGCFVLAINLYTTVITTKRNGSYVYHGWLGPTIVVYTAPATWRILVGMPVATEILDKVKGV